MRFVDVAKDAIDLAANGFPMHPFLYNNLMELRHKYLQWPENAAIYLPRNGNPCLPGEIFYQKDLAATMQKMVTAEHRVRLSGRQAALKAARDEFYRGIHSRSHRFASQAEEGVAHGRRSFRVFGGC
jgi:gamma-glutamyltranspeptidase / glutathione hydrolase